MARTKTQPLHPSPDACEHLLATIRSSAEPLPANTLARLLMPPHRIPARQLGPLLDEYVEAGKVYVLPPKTPRGKPRYWNRGALEFGRLAILAALEAKGPQTETQLVKAVRGLSGAQFQQVLQVALVAREIWRHPPLGKSKKDVFGRTAPSPEPYLRAVGNQLAAIVARLTAADVSQFDLRRALVQMIESAGVPFSAVAAAKIEHGPAAVDLAVDLIGLIRRIEPAADRGALVGARDLRRAARLDKDDFDRAVLGLSRTGRLALHRHDYPASLSPAERDDLVTDGAGTYYVGMALRQGK